ALFVSRGLAGSSAVAAREAERPRPCSGEAANLQRAERANLRTCGGYFTPGISIRVGNSGDRWIRWVAALKSLSFASKMFGTNVCGFRSMIGNHVLCTCTITRCPALNV